MKKPFMEYESPKIEVLDISKFLTLSAQDGGDGNGGVYINGSDASNWFGGNAANDQSQQPDQRPGEGPILTPL